jgi:hypothetical protein
MLVGVSVGVEVWVGVIVGVFVLVGVGVEVGAHVVKPTLCVCTVQYANGLAGTIENLTPVHGPPPGIAPEYVHRLPWQVSDTDGALPGQLLVHIRAITVSPAW